MKGHRRVLVHFLALLSLCIQHHTAVQHCQNTKTKSKATIRPVTVSGKELIHLVNSEHFVRCSSFFYRRIRNLMKHNILRRVQASERSLGVGIESLNTTNSIIINYHILNLLHKNQLKRTILPRAAEEHVLCAFRKYYCRKLNRRLDHNKKTQGRLLSKQSSSDSKLEQS